MARRLHLKVGRMRRKRNFEDPIYARGNGDVEEGSGESAHLPVPGQFLETPPLDVSLPQHEVNLKEVKGTRKRKCRTMTTSAK